jgi:hypothetical protein
MLALSLHQPWASLIGRGKLHETRHWGTSKRGAIAILAAKAWNEEYAALCRTTPFAEQLREFIMPGKTANPGMFQKVDTRIEALPFGCIVATAILKNCWDNDGITFEKDDPFDRHYIDPLDHAFGLYGTGRIAWEFDDIQILVKPVEWKGQQGIWTIDASREEIHALGRGVRNGRAA